MENQFETLRQLSELVAGMPQPTQYQCLPRQLILLSAFDWATIYEHLQLLSDDGLVQVMQADSIQFSITQKGIDEAHSLQQSIQLKKNN